MAIGEAVFVKSSTNLEQCPAPERPEYAFIGRSNVGKSSLINMLTSRKKLAKTSARPGKTQHINHFNIDKSWFLVDLPGYGWSKVSKSMKATWGKMIEEYLLNRKNLACLFVLIDLRIPPQKIDYNFMEWLGEKGIPFIMVFTKADKQSSNQNQSAVAVHIRKMKETWDELPQMFVTSATDNRGKDEIFKFIEDVNNSWNSA